MIRNVLTMAALSLSVLYAVPAAAQISTMPPASEWELGPIINGSNRTINMPLHPTQSGKTWYFDFPYPDVVNGHVHYVTYQSGSLAGASRIIMRYRIDAARGTEFIAQETHDQPATISLYVQRQGIKWSAKGRHAYDRWWAPEATLKRIRPGEYQIEASLRDPNWISVWGGTSGASFSAFQDALNDADRVGFVLGSSTARGHGVYATAPARFTLLDFRVE